MHDTSLILKDAGLVAASAAATVDSSAKIVNLGAGLVEGNMIIDVTAIEIASNDEGYRITLQGSSKANFSDTIEELASIELGAAEVLNGDQDSTVGRYIVPFRTEKNGNVWPYVRVYTEVVGEEIASGINFTARLEK